MNFKNISAPLKRWIWKRINLKVTLVSGVLPEVSSYADWCIYNEVFVDGEYDLPIHRSITRISQGGSQRVIFDLGANVGYFVLRWIDCWVHAGRPGRPPRFVLIEGSLTNCRQIERRLLAQNFDEFDIRVVHGLAGARTGGGLLEAGPAHFGNRVVSSGRGTNTQYVNLDSLVAEGEIVDLIKCDIEGSEESFVSNYIELLNSASALAIELHHGMCDTEATEHEIAKTNLTQSVRLRETDQFTVKYYEARTEETLETGMNPRSRY